MIYVDRFTAWLEIAHTPRSNATTVIDHLRQWFTTFGVPVDIASDGGPPFDSSAYTLFLRNWGIYRRLSSAYFPQSNGRAELGVKSGKRLLMANLDSTGSINRDAISRALLTYRNTPLQDCSISPAELLYGRQLRDHLPMLPAEHRDVLPKWKELRQARETVMSSRMADRAQMSRSSHTPLQPLAPGQHVLIQNGASRAPKRWDRSGLIVEALPFRQYRVKYDGSGRLQVRNRRHLKAFVPVTGVPLYPTTPSITLPEDDISTPQPTHASTPIRPGQTSAGHVSPPSWLTSPAPATPDCHPHDVVPQNIPTIAPSSQRDITAVNDGPVSPSVNNSQPVQNGDLSSTIPYDLSDPLLRRSTRTCHPPARLSPKLSGKTHIRN